MNTRFGHVTYTKLGIRLSTLVFFCKDFEIDLLQNRKPSSVTNTLKEIVLEDNFVFFLLENKTFIRIYNLDYYSNKTIEIISNKIGRQEHEIQQFFEARKYKIDNRYPLRYISSYKIDYELGGDYNFLRYDKDHIYKGNFEYRRRELEQ
ncbi:hypothetical protein [Salmonirosea aquatica]|uniref:Uncharacterized protein n=1 Tax=Salmonirosea aquatica TaxID=2654236 RepID=A0A7C9BJZ2_9BACT|nr:hypothetical protein [Cytophagaceae bacterium SJW1-29]